MSSHPTVIVGAGFTELFTALHLRHQHELRSIILIDPQERFVFKPILYELLTSELSENTVYPAYEELLKGSDINFVQDKVVASDLQGKRLTMVRHIASYDSQYTGWNAIASLGAFLLEMSTLPFIANIVSSWLRGHKAPNNSWNATELEWTTTSPPPIENFEEIPTVTAEPSGYAKSHRLTVDPS